MCDDINKLTLDGVKLIKDLKVVELKLELERRGLTKYGNKKELIERLSFFEFSKRQKSLSEEGKSSVPNQFLENDAALDNDFIREYFKSQQAVLQEHREHRSKIGECEAPACGQPSPLSDRRSIPTHGAPKTTSILPEDNSAKEGHGRKSKSENSPITTTNEIPNVDNRSVKLTIKPVYNCSVEEKVKHEKNKSPLLQTQKSTSANKNENVSYHHHRTRRKANLEFVNNETNPPNHNLEIQSPSATKDCSDKVPSLKIKLPHSVPKKSTIDTSSEKELDIRELSTVQSPVHSPKQISTLKIKTIPNPQIPEVSSSVKESTDEPFSQRSDVLSENITDKGPKEPRVLLRVSSSRLSQTQANDKKNLTSSLSETSVKNKISDPSPVSNKDRKDAISVDKIILKTMGGQLSVKQGTDSFQNQKAPIESPSVEPPLSKQTSENIASNMKMTKTPLDKKSRGILLKAVRNRAVAAQIKPVVKLNKLSDKSVDIAQRRITRNKMAKEVTPVFTKSKTDLAKSKTDLSKSNDNKNSSKSSINSNIAKHPVQNSMDSEAKKNDSFSEFEFLKQQIELPLHVEKFPTAEKEISSTTELLEKPKPILCVNNNTKPFRTTNTCSLDTPILSAHMAIEGGLENVPDSQNLDLSKRLIQSSVNVSEESAVLDDTDVSSKPEGILADSKMKLKDSYHIKNLIGDIQQCSDSSITIKKIDSTVKKLTPNVRPFSQPIVSLQKLSKGEKCTKDTMSAAKTVNPSISKTTSESMNKNIIKSVDRNLMPVVTEHTSTEKKICFTDILQQAAMAADIGSDSYGDDDSIINVPFKSETAEDSGAYCGSKKSKYFPEIDKSIIKSLPDSTKCAALEKNEKSIENLKRNEEESKMHLIEANLIKAESRLPVLKKKVKESPIIKHLELATSQADSSPDSTMLLNRTGIENIAEHLVPSPRKSVLEEGMKDNIMDMFIGPLNKNESLRVEHKDESSTSHINQINRSAVNLKSISMEKTVEKLDLSTEGTSASCSMISNVSENRNLNKSLSLLDAKMVDPDVACLIKDESRFEENITEPVKEKETFVFETTGSSSILKERLLGTNKDKVSKKDVASIKQTPSDVLGDKVDQISILDNALTSQINTANAKLECSVLENTQSLCKKEGRVVSVKPLSNLQSVDTVCQQDCEKSLMLHEKDCTKLEETKIDPMQKNSQKIDANIHTELLTSSEIASEEDNTLQVSALQPVQGDDPSVCIEESFHSFDLVANKSESGDKTCFIQETSDGKTEGSFDLIENAKGDDYIEKESMEEKANTIKGIVNINLDEAEKDLSISKQVKKLPLKEAAFTKEKVQLSTQENIMAKVGVTDERTNESLEKGQMFPERQNQTVSQNAVNLFAKKEEKSAIEFISSVAKEDTLTEKEHNCREKISTNHNLKGNEITEKAFSLSEDMGFDSKELESINFEKIDTVASDLISEKLESLSSEQMKREENSLLNVKDLGKFSMMELKTKERTSVTEKLESSVSDEIHQMESSSVAHQSESVVNILESQRLEEMKESESVKVSSKDKEANEGIMTEDEVYKVSDESSNEIKEKENFLNVQNLVCVKLKGNDNQPIAQESKSVNSEEILNKEETMEDFVDESASQVDKECLLNNQEFNLNESEKDNIDSEEINEKNKSFLVIEETGLKEMEAEKEVYSSITESIANMKSKEGKILVTAEGACATSNETIPSNIEKSVCVNSGGNLKGVKESDVLQLIAEESGSTTSKKFKNDQNTILSVTLKVDDKNETLSSTVQEFDVSRLIEKEPDTLGKISGKALKEISEKEDKLQSQVCGEITSKPSKEIYEKEENLNLHLSGEISNKITEISEKEIQLNSSLSGEISRKPSTEMSEKKDKLNSQYDCEILRKTEDTQNSVIFEESVNFENEKTKAVQDLSPVILKDDREIEFVPFSIIEESTKEIENMDLTDIQIEKKVLLSTRKESINIKFKEKDETSSLFQKLKSVEFKVDAREEKSPSLLNESSLAKTRPIKKSEETYATSKKIQEELATVKDVSHSCKDFSLIGEESQSENLSQLPKQNVFHKEGNVDIMKDGSVNMCLITEEKCNIIPKENKRKFEEQSPCTSVKISECIQNPENKSAAPLSLEKSPKKIEMALENKEIDTNIHKAIEASSCEEDVPIQKLKAVKEIAGEEASIAPQNVESPCETMVQNIPKLVSKGRKCVKNVSSSKEEENNSSLNNPTVKDTADSLIDDAVALLSGISTPSDDISNVYKDATNVPAKTVTVKDNEPSGNAKLPWKFSMTFDKKLNCLKKTTIMENRDNLKACNPVFSLSSIQLPKEAAPSPSKLQALPHIPTNKESFLTEDQITSSVSEFQGRDSSGIRVEDIPLPPENVGKQEKPCSEAVSHKDISSNSVTSMMGRRRKEEAEPVAHNGKTTNDQITINLKTEINHDNGNDEGPSKRKKMDRSSFNKLEASPEKTIKKDTADNKESDSQKVLLTYEDDPDEELKNEVEEPKPQRIQRSRSRRSRRSMDGNKEESPTKSKPEIVMEKMDLKDKEKKEEAAGKIDKDKKEKKKEKDTKEKKEIKETKDKKDKKDEKDERDEKKGETEKKEMKNESDKKEKISIHSVPLPEVPKEEKISSQQKEDSVKASDCKVTTDEHIEEKKSHVSKSSSRDKDRKSRDNRSSCKASRSPSRRVLKSPSRSRSRSSSRDSHRRKHHTERHRSTSKKGSSKDAKVDKSDGIVLEKKEFKFKEEIVEEKSKKSIKEEKDDSENEKILEDKTGEDTTSKEVKAAVDTTFKSIRKVSISRSKSKDDDLSKTKRRKWGSISEDKGAMEISSNSLKSLMPDVKPLSASEVKLESDSEEEKKKPQRTVVRKSSSVSKNHVDEDLEIPEDVDINDIIKDAESPRGLTPSDEEIEYKRKSRKDRDVSPFKRKRIEKSKTIRKIRVVEAGPVSTSKPIISAARNPQSRVVLIQNLVRPFTIKQLRDLLQRTGKLQPNGFWIDAIKSKCLAMYETEDQAHETRVALHGVKWPTINPKNLFVDFSTEEELMKKLKENTVTNVISVEEPKYDRRKVGGAIREWDLAKLGERSPGEREREKERQRREREEEKILREKLRAQSPKEEKLAKKEPQVKSLDDLFKKTRSQPSIYWLPLTPSQILEKEAMRRKRMAENERQVAEARAERMRQRAEREKERQKRREREKEREKERRRTRSRSRRRTKSPRRRSPRRSPRRSRKSGSADSRRSRRRSKPRSRSRSRSRSHSRGRS